MEISLLGSERARAGNRPGYSTPCDRLPIYALRGCAPTALMMFPQAHTSRSIDYVCFPCYSSCDEKWCWSRCLTTTYFLRVAFGLRAIQSSERHDEAYHPPYN